jgi:hypothetical protein
MENNKFNYVIARKWFDDSNQLNCYTYHNTVFYGTMEDAEDQLEFIKGRADKNADQYKIYKINDEPLKNNLENKL